MTLAVGGETFLPAFAFESEEFGSDLPVLAVFTTPLSDGCGTTCSVEPCGCETDTCPSLVSSTVAGSSGVTPLEGEAAGAAPAVSACAALSLLSVGLLLAGGGGGSGGGRGKTILIGN